MKIMKHIIIVCVCLFVILGIPFLHLYSARAEGDADAVTGASVILDQPSGSYYIFINNTRRKDAETLKIWKQFFEGKEISYVFEDIVCHVAASDRAGLEMAASFQSRLPENQMQVVEEDGTLMLSKAEYGNYDIIIMSKEACDMYHTDKLSSRTDCTLCRMTGDTE